MVDMEDGVLTHAANTCDGNLELFGHCEGIGLEDFL